MSVYLDHNATSPVIPEVLATMRTVFEATPGNPSSPHAPGQEARAAVDRARRQVGGLIGGRDGDLLFTGSGTEAVHLGMVGSARADAGERRHIVVSAIEHTAGLDAALRLEQRGWEISRVRPEGSGAVSPEAVAAALRDDTVLVSVMHANNETGVVQPVEAIAGLCRERGVLYHVDAVQSVGKVRVDAAAWGADLVSIAAHKMGGPPGVGALWKRRNVALVPVIPGRQEYGLRGGTHSTAGIVGFGTAAAHAGARLDEAGARMRTLRDRLETAVADRIPGARLTGGTAPRLPNTSHFTFDPGTGSDLVTALDLEGIAVASGSACTSGSEEPSHVLRAMGMSDDRARTAVRVSLGTTTRPEEIDRLVNVLERVVSARRVSAGSRP